jgi:hypothetical protein
MEVGCEVLTAVVMKNTIFWDTMPCSTLSTDVSEEHIASIFRVEEQASKALPGTCLHADFLLDLFFYLEDGSDTFLRNISLIFNRLYGVISQKMVLFKWFHCFSL